MLLDVAGDRCGKSYLDLRLPLQKTGLVTLGPTGTLSLDQRHPAFGEVWSTLGAIGNPEFCNAVFATPERSLAIDPDRPLGHKNRLAFRVLFYVARAGLEFTGLALLRMAIRDASITEI
jgi:hypothetical protein